MGSKKLTENAKRNTLWKVDPNDLTIVGLDTEHAFGEHPLRVPDDRLKSKLSKNFVETLAERIYHPIIVRKVDNALEVQSGRRRVRGARKINEKRKKDDKILVPVLVVNGDDKDSVLTMVKENAQRLDDTPMSKAHLLGMMLDQGITLKEAAKAFDVSITAVRNWKRLLELEPEVAKKVDEGEVSSSAAIEIAKLAPEEQKKTLEKLEASTKDGKKVTTQDATQARRKKKKSRAATPYTPPKRKVVSRLVKRADSLGLPDDAIVMLKWLTGHGQASDVFGLDEALQQLEREQQYSVSDAQQLVIDRLAAEGPKIESEVNKKTMAALAKRGIVEGHKGDDGVMVIRLTEDYCKAMGIDRISERASSDDDSSGDDSSGGDSEE